MKSFKLLVESYHQSRDRTEREKLIKEEISKLRMKLAKPNFKVTNTILWKLVFLKSLGNNINFALKNFIQINSDSSEKRKIFLLNSIQILFSNDYETTEKVVLNLSNYVNNNTDFSVFCLKIANEFDLKVVSRIFESIVIEILNSDKEIISEEKYFNAIILCKNIAKENPEIISKINYDIFLSRFKTHNYDYIQTYCSFLKFLILKEVFSTEKLEKSIGILMRILKKILVNRISNDIFIYKGIISPYLIISILEIFQNIDITIIDQKELKEYLSILQNKTEVNSDKERSLISLMIFFECLKTIITLYKKSSQENFLEERSFDLISRFISVRDSNLRAIALHYFSIMLTIPNIRFRLISYRHILVNLENEEDQNIRLSAVKSIVLSTENNYEESFDLIAKFYEKANDIYSKEILNYLISIILNFTNNIFEKINVIEKLSYIIKINDKEYFTRFVYDFFLNEKSINEKTIDFLNINFKFRIYLILNLNIENIKLINAEHIRVFVDDLKVILLDTQIEINNEDIFNSFACLFYIAQNSSHDISDIIKNHIKSLFLDLLNYYKTLDSKTIKNKVLLLLDTIDQIYKNIIFQDKSHSDNTANLKDFFSESFGDCFNKSKEISVFLLDLIENSKKFSINLQNQRPSDNKFRTSYYLELDNYKINSANVVEISYSDEGNLIDSPEFSVNFLISGEFNPEYEQVILKMVFLWKRKIKNLSFSFEINDNLISNFGLSATTNKKLIDFQENADNCLQLFFVKFKEFDGMPFLKSKKIIDGKMTDFYFYVPINFLHFFFKNEGLTIDEIENRWNIMPCETSFSIEFKFKFEFFKEQLERFFTIIKTKNNFHTSIYGNGKFLHHKNEIYFVAETTKISDLRFLAIIKCVSNSYKVIELFRKGLSNLFRIKINK